MAPTLSLELCLCLLLLPNMAIDVSNVYIQSLADKRTGRYCSVAFRGCSVLAMTFEEDAGPSCVQRVNRHIVEVIDESIQ